MHHVTNLCCSMLYKRYKSDLIKSGKDLFPGASETERLAERLAVPLLLLLRLLFSLSSDADLLPKMNEWCAPGFRILSQPHTHTHTHAHKPVFSLCLASQPPHPDTISAIHTYINRRQPGGMLISIAARGAAVTCTQTKINGNLYTREGLTKWKWFTAHGHREINHMCQQDLSFTCFLCAGCHNQQNISHSTDSLGKF